MKKNLISIAAAALLTSTVFIGCGSDDDPTPPKIVKVSDGYVVGAKVLCGTETKVANEVADKPGSYECVNGYGGGHLTSEGGKIFGTDAEAIDMSAPEGYTNITPLTTLLVEGLTPEELSQAFKLNTANFDVDVVEVAKENPELAKAAKMAAVILAASMSGKETSASNDATTDTTGAMSDTTNCLPGDICTQTPSTDNTSNVADGSSNSTEDTTNTTDATTGGGLESHLPKLRATTNSILSLTDFINAIKSGKSIKEALNEQGATKIVEIVDYIENKEVDEIEDLDNDPKIKQAISEPEEVLNESSSSENNQEGMSQTPNNDNVLPGQDTQEQDYNVPTGQDYEEQAPQEDENYNPDNYTQDEQLLPGETPSSGSEDESTSESTQLPGQSGDTSDTDDTTSGITLPGMDTTSNTTTGEGTTSSNNDDTTLPGMSSSDNNDKEEVLLPGM